MMYLLLQSTFNKMNHSQIGSFNMRTFAELCVSLTLQASKIVKQGYQNSDVKKYEKGFDDPVTEADFKIQTMLIKGIRNVYPLLKIVGEQDTEYTGKIDVDYGKLHKYELPEEFKLNHSYKIEDMCVWIDPIDNTKGFIEGRAEAVTILIGISCKGKAELGIIGSPFQSKNNKIEYDPSLMLGYISEQLTYELKSENEHWKWQKMHKPSPHHKVPILVMSSNHKKVSDCKISDDLKYERVLAGGAGYKAVMVARGWADLFLYSQTGTKRWDSCAGEAVVRGMGGYFVTSKGEQIHYNPAAKSFFNDDGLLCGFQPQLRDAAVKACEKFKQSKL